MHLIRLLIVSFFACLALSGCGSDNHGVNLNGSNTNNGNGPALVSQFNPVAASAAIIPFPNDLLFNGSQDGTINAPVSPSNPNDPVNALNEVGGFSTTASAYVDFSRPLANTQDFSSAVQVFQLTLDGTGVDKKLTFGTTDVKGLGKYSVSGDYSVYLEADPKDLPGQRLLIQPLKPLKPHTHYLVVIGRGLKGADGSAVQPSADFMAVRSKTPVSNNQSADIQNLSAQQKQMLSQIQQQYQPLFDGLASNDSMPRSEIVNAWTFTTQSIGSSLEALRKQANANPSPGKIALADTGKTTADFKGTKDFRALGDAEIYVGTVTLPYYLGVPTSQDPSAPKTQTWLDDTTQTPAAGVTATGAKCASISAPVSTTNCYPLPKETALVTVPVLVTVPRSSSGKIEQGDAAVIMQHGLDQNRTDLLAVADSLAQQHLVGVAIDHPLHGITPTYQPSAKVGSLEDDSNGAYESSYQKTETITAPNVASPPAQGCVSTGSSEPPYHCFGERTFNLDLNKDGTIDSSGSLYVNLSNSLVSRDNDRGSVNGLLHLYATLKNSASIPVFTGAGQAGTALQINNTQVGFMGHSLGAIAGTTFTAVEADASFPSVLANPGGGFARLLIGAPAFSSAIKAGVGAAGIKTGTRVFQNFLRLSQTEQDTGDPINYVAALNSNYAGSLPKSTHPVDLIEVIGNGGSNPPDLTVPNNVLKPPYLSVSTATVPGPLSGTDPLISQIGLKTVQLTPPVQNQKTVDGSAATQFTEGLHSSVLEPDDTVTPGNTNGKNQPNTNFKPVTLEMQCEFTGFLASGGNGIDTGCATTP